MLVYLLQGDPEKRDHPQSASWKEVLMLLEEKGLEVCYKQIIMSTCLTTVRFGGGICSVGLRTFAPIVSAHPYCARNSFRCVMPRHALSARAVEEMWRYIALVGTLISMHGFNSLKCSVTPYFLLIDHFLCRLSTFCEKLKKICIVEV